MTVRRSWGALLAVVLFGCQEKVPAPEPGRSYAADEASEPTEPEAVGEPAQSPKRPGRAVAADASVTELKKKDLEVGTGATAKKGDTVRVHYTGRLMDGTKFDSSLDRGKPFEFTLGKRQVIEGWDKGVVGMKEGGKRKLTIPSDMAYGKRGSPPKIPPDAPLVFEVELREVEP